MNEGAFVVESGVQFHESTTDRHHNHGDGSYSSDDAEHRSEGNTSQYEEASAHFLFAESGTESHESTSGDNQMRGGGGGNIGLTNDDDDDDDDDDYDDDEFDDFNPVDEAVAVLREEDSHGSSYDAINDKDDSEDEVHGTGGDERSSNSNESDQHSDASTRKTEKVGLAKSIPKHLVCPLTQQLMVEPMFADDGNTYERAAIMKWVATNNVSPMDPSCPLDTSRIRRNFMAKQLIEELVASGELEDELCADFVERKEALAQDQAPLNESDVNEVREQELPGEQGEQRMEQNHSEDSSGSSGSSSSGDETDPAAHRSFEEAKMDSEQNFDVGCFLNAVHTLKQRKLREEVYKICLRTRREYLKSYQTNAVIQTHGDGIEHQVLDKSGFQAACASINRCWDYDILDDVKNPSTKSVLARDVLRLLESDLVFVLIGVLIIVEILVAKIESSWIAILLAIEFIIRVCCYYALATHNLRTFLETKSNACGLMVTLMDFVFLGVTFSGSEMLFSDILVEYASVLRILRLASPVLRPSVAFSRSVLRRCRCLYNGMDSDGGVEEPAQPHYEAIVPNFLTFRKYISVLSQNDAKMVWPLSEYLCHFRTMGTYNGSTIHVDDLPELLKILGFDGIAALEDTEYIVSDKINHELIFFDELVEALRLLRDNKVESKVLECLAPRRLRAQRSLIIIIRRLTISIAVFLFWMFSFLSELAVNIYVRCEKSVAPVYCNPISFIYVSFKWNYPYFAHSGRF